MLIELEKVEKVISSLSKLTDNQRITTIMILRDTFNPPTQYVVCVQCNGQWTSKEDENHAFNCPTGKGGLNLKSLWERINDLTRANNNMSNQLCILENKLNEVSRKRLVDHTLELINIALERVRVMGEI